MNGASERQANDESFFPSHSEFSLLDTSLAVSHRDEGSAWCRERRCCARALINHYHDAITGATKSMQRDHKRMIRLSVMKLYRSLWTDLRASAKLVHAALHVPQRRPAEHNRLMQSDSPARRRLACARCGVTFDCSVGGDCWCAAEPNRLPTPDEATQDCLCPACLRAAAARARAG